MVQKNTQCLHLEQLDQSQSRCAGVDGDLEAGQSCASKVCQSAFCHQNQPFPIRKYDVIHARLDLKTGSEEHVTGKRKPEVNIPSPR